MCPQWKLRSACTSAQTDQYSLSAWRKPGCQMSTQRRLIRLRRSPGWSESLLGAHATLLVLSCTGSYCWTHDWSDKLIYSYMSHAKWKQVCSNSMILWKVQSQKGFCKQYFMLHIKSREKSSPRSNCSYTCSDNTECTSQITKNHTGYPDIYYSGPSCSKRR